MAWAIEQQEVKDAITQLVLICLANYAAADGSSAYPSVMRLASDTRLSERTVQYQLRKLEKMALIRKDNPAIVAARIDRADKRPNCYELLMKPRGAPYAPRKTTGCTPRQSGVHLTTERGAPHAPNPFRDPSINHKSVLKTIPEVDQEIRKRFGRAVDSLAQLKKLSAK